MEMMDYLSDSEWLIEEKSFDPEQQNVLETLFTLGNGTLGMRGVYEEIPYDTIVGTYIAGIYDKSLSQVSELVNLPNPVDFKIMVDGEKLDIKAMRVKKHWRALDVRHGLLARRTIFVDRHGNRYQYSSLRFISMADRHLGVLRIELVPLSSAANITVQTVVDTSVTNSGVLSEGRKTHYRLTKVESSRGILYTEVETFSSRIKIGYATCVKMKKAGRVTVCPDRMFSVRLRKGETVRFTKYFSIGTSRDVKAAHLKKSVVSLLKAALKRGFYNVFCRHAAVWDELWRDADIVVKGDKELQSVVRFDIYHLLICANRDNERASIGARTLSGEGYRGHVFWDAELYMFPFYLYSMPEVARNMLRYRYHQLERARQNAREQGYRGVLFGWETTDTGEDETPRWFKGLDGSVVAVDTFLEHHLVADVAYALNQYYLATGDEECITSWGAEILFETARFWASRVEKRKSENVYDIKGVIGPDEFHVNVNNDAFTNYMAKWNLEAAYWRYQYLKGKYPVAHRKLVRKIGLSRGEVDMWLKISRAITMPRSSKNGVIEQFDGFFKRRRIRITQCDEYFMPVFPGDVSVAELNKTQLIKQADVLLLFHLFPDDFDRRVIKNNFLFYERRTIHKSSLSHGMHAIVALRAGYPIRAYQYFHYAAEADLKNHHGNTRDGIHGGSIGATWQALVSGFGGLRINRDMLHFKPRLPQHWQSLSFRVKWRASVFDVLITSDRFRVAYVKPGKEKAVSVGVYENIYKLGLGEVLEVGRPKKGGGYGVRKTIYENKYRDSAG